MSEMPTRPRSLDTTPRCRSFAGGNVGVPFIAIAGREHLDQPRELAARSDSCSSFIEPELSTMKSMSTLSMTCGVSSQGGGSIWLRERVVLGVRLPIAVTEAMHVQSSRSG